MTDNVIQFPSPINPRCKVCTSYRVHKAQMWSVFYRGKGWCDWNDEYVNEDWHCPWFKQKKEKKDDKST